MTRPTTTKRGRRSAAAALAALLALTHAAAATAQDEVPDQWQRQLSIQQTGVHGVAAPPPAPAAVDPLRVTAWVDHEDNTYAVGEAVQLYVRANKDAYVTVLNVGPTGETTILFPNQFQADNRVLANTVLRVPDPGSGSQIAVGGPVGAELIKVIASTQPRPPFAAAQLGRAGPYQSVAGAADATARNLQVALTDPAGGEWDDYNKTIRTVASRPAVAAAPVAPVAAPPAALPPAGAAAPAAAWPAPAFGLRLATDKTAYRLVEPVTFMVQSDRDCHLTLLNTGPAGQMRQIYPNRYQQQTLIQAGQTVMVPGLNAGVTVRPIGPAGLETVTAVCRAGGGVPAGVLTEFGAEAFPSVGNAAAAARNLAVVTAGAPGAVAAAAATAMATVQFVVQD